MTLVFSKTLREKNGFHSPDTYFCLYVVFLNIGCSSEFGLTTAVQWVSRESDMDIQITEFMVCRHSWLVVHSSNTSSVLKYTF